MDADGGDLTGSEMCSAVSLAAHFEVSPPTPEVSLAATKYRMVDILILAYSGILLVT